MNQATQKFTRSMSKLFALAMVAVAVVVVAGCGDDPHVTGDGNSTDAAFAIEMIEHHRGAIEMAESAERRAERAEIKQLASEIVEAQQSEIALMQRIGRELKAHGVKHEPLGMNDSQMGMDFDMPMLDDASDFDKSFIDMMIPHHRGAIAMAKLQLEKGSHGELRRMADGVIDAQTKEIEQMQSWRKRWYGSELPGAIDDGSMEHGAMEHGSM